MKVLQVNGKVDKKRLVKRVLLPVVGGLVTGWLANRNAQKKYQKLKQPSFSPPGAVFPIVWTTLYGMMGLAKYRVDQKVISESRIQSSSPLYEIQLGLNYMWSFLFFKWNLRGAALIEMSALIGAIMATTTEFYKHDRVAGSLMVPYIGWVGFAYCLNYSTWKLNK